MILGQRYGFGKKEEKKGKKKRKVRMNHVRRKRF
jgi:hypothetical protein